MFDSLEIIKENSHEDASLRLQELVGKFIQDNEKFSLGLSGGSTPRFFYQNFANTYQENSDISLWTIDESCLLYTSPSPRDGLLWREASSA